ncbi:MAG: hypothetical protein AVDCRST_MAG93-4673, partial [uncultured Chloroflexia bacterium]
RLRTSMRWCGSWCGLGSDEPSNSR